MNAKYILVWLPMVLIGIANGLLRETLILEPLGDELAHQMSTVTLFVFLGVYIWYILPKTGIDSVRQSWLAGLIWILLTVFFEFGLGYVSGQSVPELLKCIQYILGSSVGHHPNMGWGCAPDLFLNLESV